MTHWNNKTKLHILNLLIISLILITVIPTNILTSVALLDVSQDKSNDLSILKGSERFSMVPKLAKDPIAYLSDLNQRNDYLGWIMHAKQEKTRQKRLNQMLDELAAGDSYMKMKYRAK